MNHNIVYHQQNWDSSQLPLTCASSPRVQRSTNTSPYSAVLCGLPPRPSIPRPAFDRSRLLKPGISNEQMRTILHVRVFVLKTATNIYIRKAQAKLENNYGRIVRKEPSVERRETDSQIKPPLLIVSDSQAETFARKPHKNIVLPLQEHSASSAYGRI